MLLGSFFSHLRSHRFTEADWLWGLEVGEVGAGDFLGEMVLLNLSSRYTATVTAVGMLRASTIDRYPFLPLLD